MIKDIIKNGLQLRIDSNSGLKDLAVENLLKELPQILVL